MAIFWEYIKGVGHKDTTSCYSWIKWGTNNTSDPIPVLYTADTNNFEDESLKTYGELALAGPNVSPAWEQNIYTNWHIKKILTLESVCRLTSDGLWCTWDNNTAKTFLEFEPSSETDILKWGHSGLRIVYTGDSNELLAFQGDYAHVFKGAVWFSDQVSMKKDLIVDKKVEALYFNATSDKRAKENLCVYTDSALDIINRVQVYTFNYRHHDKRTVGLLAQDLLDYKLNGVCLVDNIDATGVDNDYMTINESKLVYVLWKAIQEQQVLINQLTERIKKLEN